MGGGGGGEGVMGRKRGVERGPLKIFLHLLGDHDEIINESMQNHQPPPLLIKNERSLSHYYNHIPGSTCFHLRQACI